MSRPGDDVVAAATTALEVLRGPIPDTVVTVLIDGARIHRDHLRVDTAPAVAAHLIARGIRGDCHEPETCAIAVYLAGAVSLPVRCIVVAASGVSLIVTAEVTRGVPLPPAVARFINDFDAGEYPELVAPPAAGDLAVSLS